MGPALGVVHGYPEIIGGRTPVFVGTRVPVTPRFDELEAGGALDEFSTLSPSVEANKRSRPRN